MLDLHFVREHPDVVRDAIKKKRENEEKANVSKILATDERRRALVQQAEVLKRERNAASEEIGKLKREGKDASTRMAEVRRIGDDVQALDRQLAEVEAELTSLLEWLPNIPNAKVPVGDDATQNKEIRKHGEPRRFPFKPKTHIELGASLDVFDFPRATKIAGSGFYVGKGWGARLERALINFMLDLHTREHGYVECQVPVLSNRTSMRGTGQIPKLESDMYGIDGSTQFLIPTAEVPLTNLHNGEMLKESDLPLYYTGHTACFRREAGAAGKDTAGLVRVHQFNKVEMVKIVRPEESEAELESLLLNAEEVLKRLRITYRVVLLCTGDLSFGSAMTYDIEAWAPGLERWLEVSSCSNFGDFQARRANIRYRGADGKVKFVHTLNGSGLALPRVLVTLVETYQTAEGTVQIPDVLSPWLAGGGLVIDAPKRIVP
ncbi:MAG: serine--tRNA ligase [Planctomycetes bacterium]|nr:serine--tRNA ligase [Planctomycetota bacterium]MBI3846821.1 serine--tRNA ligase [Planctomycetota bacterium]